MELKRSNSLSDIEQYIGTLHHQQYICVISDANYFYLYDDTQIIMNHESLIYEGPARNYKSDL